ncbi:MAG: tRNA (adenosine(37)-N6)-dimethylallyltransferase MiaA [Candidatus Aminicenantes bacterium]|nr:tRNA (adenosine(37)-N6)-dimethylallyltransferase MiaA [Candidatus Aminicenantes bacterium]
MSSSEPRLVFIVGPTGVGKTAVALRLAEILGGEIISCDSMQVYRGFDIGTDKPTRQEQARVPHHLVDIVEAGTQFNAADFAAQAVAAISQIRNRSRRPFVVGGTGLYFKALEDGLFPGPGRDEAVRRALDEEARRLGSEALWERLARIDPVYAAKTGRRDRVRIVRALEVQTLTGRPFSDHFKATESPLSGERPVKIGLERPRAELYRRIEERVDRMFAGGLVEETRNLLARGVPDTAPPFKAFGYKHVLLFLRGRIGLDEAADLAKIDTRHYAKRQLTWFRKMPGVRWIDPGETDPLPFLSEARKET